MPHTVEDRYLSVAQIAEYVNCDRNTVLSWIGGGSGQLPAVDITRATAMRGTKHRPSWRVSLADLTEFLRLKKTGELPKAATAKRLTRKAKVQKRYV